jgi:plasmid stabilization system protein ParE
MDTAPRPDDRPDILSPETEADRRDRLAWEAKGIAEARAELDAGLYVDADEIDAWIDSIGTDHELPPPPIRRRAGGYRALYEVIPDTSRDGTAGDVRVLRVFGSGQSRQSALIHRDPGRSACLRLRLWPSSHRRWRSRQ